MPYTEICYMPYTKICHIGLFVWFVGFNVALELPSGISPTVWDSSLKMARRHAITILILHGGDGYPVFVPPKVKLEWELGGHCTCVGFNMHQVPLVYMAVFCQADLKSGLPVRSCVPCLNF